jgi:putative intracellular protease/amidase
MESLVKDKRVLLVIASNGFNAIEYLKTKKLLEEMEIKVITSSDNKGGAISEDSQVTTLVDIALQNISLPDYDGIFFIGGKGALDKLDLSISYELLNEAKDKHIPYGAIGESVRILTKSFAAVGKRITGWNGDNSMPIFAAQGNANFDDDEDIVTDELLVTVRGEKHTDLFAQGIRRVLRKKALM